ncbi:MAG: hypothetical protein FWE77_01975 [Clostridia bacterium]|nr:hypothetical protein [Clostridia bacterium]
MPILLVLAWMLFFVLCFAGTRQIVRAALGASVCFGAATVLGCELLSLLNAYTALWLSLYWLVLCGVTAVCLRSTLCAGLRALRELRPGRPPWYALVALAVIGLCAVAALLSALLYPPMNYDSMAYHMPRVIFWYKNASVHNYPTSMGRQLFMGPLNGFFILQVQVLCLGSDRLANLIQWFAYLGTIAAVYGIAAELGVGPRGRWFAAVLAATTPIALLQASSTQTDLAVTFWCLIAVHGVLVYRNGLESKRIAGWAACIGGAAGLALLTKLNALAMLGPFALLALALMLRRRAWRALRVAAPVVLLCTLLINAGFFVRNAAGLHGDFLAYRMPESDALHARSDDPRDYALLGIKIFAASLGGTPFNTINNAIDAVVETAAERIGVPLNQENISEVPFMASMYGHAQSHDTRTNPMQAAVSYLVLLALMCGAVFGKDRKSRRFPAACALAVTAAYLVTALSMRWSTSIPRYLLPPLMASYGLVALAFRGKPWLRKLACIGLACAMLFAVPAMAFNRFQPLVHAPRLSAWLSGNPLEGIGTRHNTGYEDMRAYSMGVDPNTLWAMLRQAEGESGSPLRLGIDQSRCLSAIYPVLYVYRSDAHDVRYINAAYLAEKEDPAFVPQVVFSTVRALADAPEVLAYHGARYVLTAAEPAAFGTLCLYLKAAD